MSDMATPEEEYPDVSNQAPVPNFTRLKHVLVDGLTHHGAKVLGSLDVRPGDRVVDVGCGFGDIAIELARIVGPEGSVLGLDRCEGFLEHGRRDAAQAGLRNIRFKTAEVQTYPFASKHDLCFSRFGTQFFENPVAALRNMRMALRPGGRMAMIVWRGIDDNPWLGVPKDIVSRFLPPPAEDARSCRPGSFQVADPGEVTKQLEIAGYEGITFERIDAPLLVGWSPADAVAFQLALGPAGEIYREAGADAERLHDEIAAALETELARHRTDEGIVMQSSAWKVAARRPQAD